MSDAHAKTDTPAAGNAGGVSVKEVSKYVFWFIVIVLVAVFGFIFVLANPKTVQNLIYFLQGLQVLFLFVIAFCFYKLQDFRKRFLASCHQIDHIYADKNGQGHHGHDDHGHHESHADNDSHHVIHHKKEHKHEKILKKSAENILEERFQRAVKSVGSSHAEEWRVGLIELDKILKDLLVKNKYNGDTLDELLQDAKAKNFTQIQNAELATQAKRYLTKNMVKLPEEKDKINFDNTTTLYKMVIAELLD